MTSKTLVYGQTCQRLLQTSLSTWHPQAALCQERQTFRVTESGNPVGYWWPRGVKDLIHDYGLQQSHSGLSHGREVTDALQIRWSLQLFSAKNALPWT